MTFPCGGTNIRSGFSERCETRACEICPCGYTDGCNECFCDSGGEPSCTERACLPGTVQSLECLECREEEEPCCDTNRKPGPDFLCCADGTWTRQFSSGWAQCPNGDYITRFGQGDLCAVMSRCCDPLKEPGRFGNPRGREGHACCSVTGEWVFNIGDGRRYGKYLFQTSSLLPMPNAAIPVGTGS